MSQDRWQTEMMQASTQFCAIFSYVTEKAIFPDDYYYRGGPIIPRLRDVFGKFCSGDLDSLDNTAHRLNDLNMRLGRDYKSLLAEAEDYLDNWEGDAAQGARSYMRDMRSALDRKRDCLEALTMVVHAQRAVVEKFRSDVLDLIEKTNSGIEQAQANQVKLTLAVVGAVAGVIGAFALTGPIGFAVVGAMGGGLAGVFSAQLDGHNVAQVIVSMVMAAERLVEHAEGARTQVEEGFAEVTRYLTGNELKWIRPDRPRIVADGGFEPDDFHPEGGYTPEVRDRVPKGDVAVEPPEQPDRPSDHGPWGRDEDAYPEQFRG